MNTEALLVQRSQEGDLDSFNQLVELFQSYVYNLSFRMLRNESSAADATQEAFLSAYRAIGGFRGGSFRSWILRIAANTCKDMMRAAKARPSVSLDELEADPSALPQSKAEPPEEYAARMELASEIQRGLDTLPHDQKLAIVLVDIQGFSYEDAATVMSTSLGTVKSRLSRARHQLRNYLRGRPELLPSQFRLDA